MHAGLSIDFEEPFPGHAGPWVHAKVLSKGSTFSQYTCQSRRAVSGGGCDSRREAWPPKMKGGPTLVFSGVSSEASWTSSGSLEPSRLASGSSWPSNYKLEISQYGIRGE